MTHKHDKFAKALDNLINEGFKLLAAMLYECKGMQHFKQVIAHNVDEKKLQEIINNLPSFSHSYQSWYSESLVLIKQILPDRLSDFQSYYEYPKHRKNIDHQNYMVKDYLQGLRVGAEHNPVVDMNSAIPEFEQQLNILRAAKETLDSILINLKKILQSDLFDSEIDSAKALAKAGHLRAAGAICGVIIEKHLKQICESHSISTGRKKATISNLNDTLKDNKTISIPQWRHIQLLADIRNICDHATGKEPSTDQIDDLLSGTEKVLKTVF